MTRGERFWIGNVDTGASKVASFQGIDQCGGADDRTAAGIVDDRSRFHTRKPRSIEKTVGFRGQRNTDRDMVGLSECVVQPVDRAVGHTIHEVRSWVSAKYLDVDIHTQRFARQRLADVARTQDEQARSG